MRKLATKFLDTLDDMECDRIMRLSHADLVAEAVARGEDPDQIVLEVSDTIQRAKADAYRIARWREEQP